MKTKQRVKELLEAGLSQREIADLLHISTQAVNKHRRSLGIPPPSQKKDKS